VAWTLADLAGHEHPDEDEVAAALDFRRASPAAGTAAERG
jgi:predicted ATPase with chaperone activity